MRLYAAYVRLIEIGRERIIAAGGTCDPVDVMEQGDSALARVRDFFESSDFRTRHQNANESGLQ